MSAAGKSNLNSRGGHRCRERGQGKQIVAPVPRFDLPATAESPAGAISQRAYPVLPWGGQCSTPIGAAFGWPPSNEPGHMELRDSSQIMTDALACKNATLGAREYSTRIEVQPEPDWGAFRNLVSNSALRARASFSAWSASSRPRSASFRARASSLQARSVSSRVWKSTCPRIWAPSPATRQRRRDEGAGRGRPAPALSQPASQIPDGSAFAAVAVLERPRICLSRCRRGPSDAAATAPNFPWRPAPAAARKHDPIVAASCCRVG